MTNPVLYLIFPRMLAVVHPARTTQFANLVSQAKGIAAYVFLDILVVVLSRFPWRYRRLYISHELRWKK